MGKVMYRFPEHKSQNRQQNDGQEYLGVIEDENLYHPEKSADYAVLSHLPLPVVICLMSRDPAME